MINLPLNPRSNQAILDYLKNPGQALGLIGNEWLGSKEVATLMAEQLLEIKPGSISSYPYFLNIGNNQLSSISIDEIRAINQFIMLKVPEVKKVSRIIYIERAERMTLEAQNALLKNLEEPPKSTVFILSAESTSQLLATIVSRLHAIQLSKPALNDLTQYFSQQGYAPPAIKEALLIADGWPLLTRLILSAEDNSVREAITSAKKLLATTSIDKLAAVNDLSKNKTGLPMLFFVIKQMAKIGLTSTDHKAACRWRQILKATTETEQRLDANVQLKLLLTDYMLAIT